MPSTPIAIRVINWTIFLLIQFSAFYKVMESEVAINQQLKEFTSILFILPYFAISICCTIALLKIRSFYKSKGLGHRIDTCKIAFHSSIFTFFSIEIVWRYLCTLVGWKEAAALTEKFFTFTLDLGDLAVVWLLYQLGTKQADV